ncbi:unnamed protein product, partial [Amoebophrya sp. A120]|eukprot:GSA120T00015214001.1
MLRSLGGRPSECASKSSPKASDSSELSGSAAPGYLPAIKTTSECDFAGARPRLTAGSFPSPDAVGSNKDDISILRRLSSVSENISSLWRATSGRPSQVFVDYQLSPLLGSSSVRNKMIMANEEQQERHDDRGVDVEQLRPVAQQQPCARHGLRPATNRSRTNCIADAVKILERLRMRERETNAAMKSNALPSVVEWSPSTSGSSIADKGSCTKAIGGTASQTTHTKATGGTHTSGIVGFAKSVFLPGLP